MVWPDGNKSNVHNTEKRKRQRFAEVCCHCVFLRTGKPATTRRRLRLLVVGKAIGAENQAVPFVRNQEWAWHKKPASKKMLIWKSDSQCIRLFNNGLLGSSVINHP